MNVGAMVVAQMDRTLTSAELFTTLPPGTLPTDGFALPADGWSDALWRSAVERTRERSPASFDQWFSGVQFDGCVDGMVALRAANEFVREWVEEHFLPTLRDELQSLTGWSVRFSWTLDTGLDRPVADKPLQAPVRARPLTLRPPAPLTMHPPALLPTLLNGEASPSPEMPPASTTLRVADPASGMSGKYSFANFVVGPSNQLAHAASVAAAGGGGPKHNPLFLCGGTGLGKTHLVHAVAHRVRSDRPDARIVYTSAERFVNEFVTALSEQRMHQFRAKYREQCDLLLVDDIQFLAGKTQTQEEFFHAFNALHQAGKQILVTSDKYPQQLEKMEERLISRFSWGLVADIQSPELETRVAIVRNKALSEGIPLGDDVMLYIAQTVRNNVRELEGALIRIMAKASLLGRGVDIDFVRQELASTATLKANEANIDDIQRAVCHHFKLKSADLASKDRHKTLAFARHLAMYLCKVRLKSSFPEIGRAFGNRDHTTVMSAVRKVDVLRTTDPETRAHLEVLERKLGVLD